MNHKWDLITDTCTKCGLVRRIHLLYSKDGFYKTSKRVTEYFIDRKWITKRPECIT